MSHLAKRISSKRMLPGSIALGVVFALAGTAQAGDAAARRIIGFSPDGHYFAFEQYGTLDWSETGSGWSEIAIVDTQTDQFVGGKPITIADEKPDATLTLSAARSLAAKQAAPLLAKYKIASRGQRVAFDKFTFPDDLTAYAEIARVEQVSQKWLSATFDELGISTIQLNEILIDSSTDCSSSFDEASPKNIDKARGFSLTLQGHDGKAFKTLHTDKSVPASRKCPTSYSLSEAYVFKPKDKPPVIAVLVQRFSQGYEGRDRRFIAVTGQVR
jgi:predicted secreted protein